MQQPTTNKVDPYINVPLKDRKFKGLFYLLKNQPYKSNFWRFVWTCKDQEKVIIYDKNDLNNLKIQGGNNGKDRS